MCSLFFILVYSRMFLLLLKMFECFKILEAYNTGVEAFRQHKSDGLTSDRIDNTMLNIEEVQLGSFFVVLKLSLLWELFTNRILSVSCYPLLILVV